MISANRAKVELIKMLRESGFNFDSPDPKLAWEIFKNFFSTKVDCADDALLFQYGVYRDDGSFEFDFTTQFIFEEDGEYDRMEQLHLTFYYRPNKELEDLNAHIWTYDCDSINEFFSRVENMNNFKTLIEKYVPIRCEIAQEQV
jgi:hypothetical protein